MTPASVVLLTHRGEEVSDQQATHVTRDGRNWYVHAGALRFTAIRDGYACSYGVLDQTGCTVATGAITPSLRLLRQDTITLDFPGIETTR